MLRQLDNFYAEKEEPLKSCLLAIRQIILAYDKNITEAWKYSMPFFCFQGKMFCYVWINKKTQQPYIGIVEGKRIEHPLLIIGGRSRMKIIMLDAEKDLPIKTINVIFKMTLNLYRNGIIAVKHPKKNIPR